MSLGKVNHFTGKDEGSLGNHLRDRGRGGRRPLCSKEELPPWNNKVDKTDQYNSLVLRFVGLIINSFSVRITKLI